MGKSKNLHYDIVDKKRQAYAVQLGIVLAAKRVNNQPTPG